MSYHCLTAKIKVELSACTKNSQHWWGAIILKSGSYLLIDCTDWFLLIPYCFRSKPCRLLPFPDCDCTSEQQWSRVKINTKICIFFSSGSVILFSSWINGQNRRQSTAYRSLPNVCSSGCTVTLSLRISIINAQRIPSGRLNWWIFLLSS